MKIALKVLLVLGLLNSSTGFAGWGDAIKGWKPPVHVPHHTPGSVAEAMEQIPRVEVLKLGEGYNRINFVHPEKMLAALPSDGPAAVDRLLAQYKANKQTEDQIYEAINKPGIRVDHATADVADDERILGDLRAEYIFWGEVEKIANTFGVGALGGLAVYATRLLKDVEAFAPARFAMVVTGIAALASEGAKAGIASQKSTLAAEIDSLEKDIEYRVNYLNWQAERDGSIEALRPPTCIYGYKCVRTQVCGGFDRIFSPEECNEKLVCGDALISCEAN